MLRSRFPSSKAPAVFLCGAKRLRNFVSPSFFATVKAMAKEYATVQVHNGVIFRVDIGYPNGSPEDAQFAGLTKFPLVYALNKLAELEYVPLAGAISHGEIHPGGASYTLIFSREK
jgi:hypothetical protein